MRTERVSDMQEEKLGEEHDPEKGTWLLGLTKAFEYFCLCVNV